LNLRQDLEASFVKSVVDIHKLFVVDICQTSLGGDVHYEANFACKLTHGHWSPIDIVRREFEERVRVRQRCFLNRLHKDVKRSARSVTVEV